MNKEKHILFQVEKGGRNILASIMELARESNNYIGESKKRDADIKKGVEE